MPSICPVACWVNEDEESLSSHTFWLHAVQDSAATFQSSKIFPSVNQASFTNFSSPIVIWDRSLSAFLAIQWSTMCLKELRMQVFTLSFFPTTTLPHLSTGIIGGHPSLAITELRLHL
uniref:Uncharacterized protein n=1 Tax=Rattus norvegicus TaxID=10116 RepID=Q63063_RAT|nr:unknown protein [Rattus norvegicus]